MTPPLLFVVAPATQLPEATTSLEDLQLAQASGPSTGSSLRNFNRGAEHPDLVCSPVSNRYYQECLLPGVVPCLLVVPLLLLSSAMRR